MKLNALIVSGTLIAILTIFFFSFFYIRIDVKIDPSEIEKINRIVYMIERTKENDQTEFYSNQIDIVYFWTHPEISKYYGQWRNLMRKNKGEKKIINDLNTFSAGLFRYVLRGIEQNLSWFRKLIILVPDFVDEYPFDEKHPKIQIIKHSEFIPNEALPNFNWRTIFLNAWNLSQISEQFLFMNDQTFLLKPISPSLFKNTNGAFYLSTKQNRDVSNNSQIFESSTQILRDCMINNEQFLGFENLQTNLQDLESVNFETEGLFLLDKKILSKITQICSTKFENSKYYKLMNKDSLDLILMHQIFIREMGELFKKNSQKVPKEFKFVLSKSHSLYVDEDLGPLISKNLEFDITSNDIKTLWFEPKMMTYKNANNRKPFEFLLEKLFQNRSELELRLYSYENVSLYIVSGFFGTVFSFLYFISKYLLKADINKN